MAKNPPAVDVVEAVISPEVVAMRKRLEEHVKKDAAGKPVIENGQLVADKNAFAKILPEDLTVETFKRVQDTLSLVAAAGTLMVGEIGTVGMEADANLDKVSMKLPTVGRDYFNFEMKRSVQVPVFEDKVYKGTTPKYGVATASLVVQGTRDVGEMARIRDLLSSQATSKLAPKK